MLGCPDGRRGQAQSAYCTCLQSLARVPDIASFAAALAVARLDTSGEWGGGKEVCSWEWGAVRGWPTPLPDTPPSAATPGYLPTFCTGNQCHLSVHPFTNKCVCVCVCVCVFSSSICRAFRSQRGGQRLDLQGLAFASLPLVQGTTYGKAMHGLHSSQSFRSHSMSSALRVVDPIKGPPARFHVNWWEGARDLLHA